ncbi:hypothetical protein RLO149_c017420 [Roseobacter litoralis Och 149]|uniref:Uncharacterized protein n=1 Tax=Roseobacter litoralis (strain ATCC 49566 / DSM 6996 / JCM 21268 / NBRC 15278 / OCh 149) TaxID=391595 RepID=F7ZIL5_ROSLO|nr:hypothetical protein RLO149_c017420 [Roseobacter litoralis Och 149]
MSAFFGLRLLKQGAASGIGHRASGIGHRASGIGHRASGIGHRVSLRHAPLCPQGVSVSNRCEF